MEQTINVYCPVCRERAGKNKLLFKKALQASGVIYIQCRGCKEQVKIELSQEPVSRLSE